MGDVDSNLKQVPNIEGPLLHYAFSIKKCGMQHCTICLPPQLPPDVFSTLPDPVTVPDPENYQHYKTFDDLYGTLTSKKHRPSLKDGRRQSHDMPFSPSGQTAANVGELILCSECLRPRVMYSQRKLNHDNVQVLLRSIEHVLYVCGSKL